MTESSPLHSETWFRGSLDLHWLTYIDCSTAWIILNYAMFRPCHEHMVPGYSWMRKGPARLTVRHSTWILRYPGPNHIKPQMPRDAAAPTRMPEWGQMGQTDFGNSQCWNVLTEASIFMGVNPFKEHPYQYSPVECPFQTWSNMNEVWLSCNPCASPSKKWNGASQRDQRKLA